MKKGIFAALIAFALASSAYAAQPSFSQRFAYDRDTTELFRANEFSLDLFGAYNSAQSRLGSISTRSLRQGEWGGGIGINYFFTRYVGIASDTHWMDWEGSFIDNVTASLVVRAPLDNIRLAPYAFGGAGRIFEGRDSWSAHAGGGLEFRLNPHLGLFADGRYTWVDHGGDFAMARFGVRVGF